MTNEPNDLAEDVRVEFEIGLNTVVAHSYRQTSEDDYAQTPITLGELVADRIAQNLRADAAKLMRDTMSYRDIAGEAITEAAEARVNDALNRITQATDPFGNVKGEPKTIAELVSDRVEAWFKEPQGDGFSRQRTRMQKLLDDAIEYRFCTDLGKAVEEGKKQVLAALTAEAEQAITKAVAGILTKKAGL